MRNLRSARYLTIWRALASGRQFAVSIRISGVQGGFIGIVYAREAFDLPPAGLGVHPFDVALLAQVQGRIDEDLNKAIFAYEPATLIPCRTVRAHGGADYNTVVGAQFPRLQNQSEECSYRGLPC